LLKAKLKNAAYGDGQTEDADTFKASREQKFGKGRSCSKEEVVWKKGVIERTIQRWIFQRTDCIRERRKKIQECGPRHKYNKGMACKGRNQ
jgi:hypothetical protein